MALKLSMVDAATGVQMPDAYVRITEYTGDKENVRYRTGIYLDAAARVDGRRQIRTRPFSVPVADLSGDMLPALYGHLKTQPGFETAVDC